MVMTMVYDDSAPVVGLLEVMMDCRLLTELTLRDIEVLESMYSVST